MSDVLILDVQGRYLATLPYFVLYFAVTLALVAAFLSVYMLTTRYPEWRLIRDGNNAAAITLVGAVLGFVLPLAMVISSSINLVDMVVWGIVAMVVQLAAYLVMRRAQPQFDESIRAGRTAPAVAQAGFSVGIGILNAACITY
jgi:putative membrane protein